MILDSWQELNQFANLDFQYSVRSSRDYGERVLANAAMHSSVEYAWEFDADQLLWHHFGGVRKFESIEDQRFRVGLYLTDAHLVPVGQHSSMYHIHPEKITLKKKPLVPICIQNQIPSSEDVKTTVRLIHNGYEDAKIVTTSGVTTINTERTDRFRSLPVILRGLTIGSEAICDHLASHPFDRTMDWLFDQFNEHYGGELTFGYQPFTRAES